MTSDIREWLAESAENGDRCAESAIEILCYRAAKDIGSYLAAMNGANAIVFTGGIGENAPEVRRLISEKLSWMGIKLNSGLTRSSLTERKESSARTRRA